MADDLPFKAEYAKSGRAGCKGCKLTIAKDSLRIAKMVQVAMSCWQNQIGPKADILDIVVPPTVFELFVHVCVGYNYATYSTEI